ncbi:sirohydrochlorin chelatase [Actinokineospora bangkokensis]|uniref:Sirohydrochlorin chelatase n=1 Tax=Actinokineospora bangkokensis TaxID=1193682 RepID=A0A1Q9LU17_9PSEU|nr:sirohydrochlorin chelatase [Actinokineospora bangkokensis]
MAVAHGSRDPRSAAAVAELLAAVRARRPDLDVRGAFLDLSRPLLADVLDAARGPVVVVPLLLGRAFHARVDLPGLVEAAQRRNRGLSVRVAGVLGPDARLEAAALRRLSEAGVVPGDPEVGVVLAATGSSHPPANARVHEIARRWAGSFGWAGVRPAFASATTPDVPSAVAALRARGAARIAVASWFLAPGLLPDRVAAQAAGAVVAAPLGAAETVADVVVDRYAEALGSGALTA